MRSIVLVMNAVMFLLVSPLALAAEVKKEQTLAKAVEAFNEKAQQNTTGKAQAPLTEEELIAAILQWTNDRQEAPKAYYEAIQEVARTKTLPPNASLSFTTGYRNSQHREFTVWWIDLTLEKEVEGASGYTHRIRNQWIRCREADANAPLQPSPPPVIAAREKPSNR